MDLSARTSTKTYIILLIAYSVIGLFFVILSYSNLQEDTENLLSVAKNWHTNPIMDIEVKQDCSPGYEEAITSSWQGTEEGCWCGNISYSQKQRYGLFSELYTGACSANQTNATCINIRRESPKPLAFWSQVNYTKAKICVKRSKESWASVANVSNYICPSNMKKCGFSPNNIFCTKQERCPINSIEVEMIRSDQWELVQNCTNEYNCTVLSQTPSFIKLLKYKRGDAHDALPTVELRINEHSMCKDPSRDNITPRRNDYQLYRSRRSSCNEEGKSMWNLTDSITEEDLFRLNDISYIIEKYEHFGGYYTRGSSGKNYTWHLFRRDYVPWNVKCRNQMEQILEKMESIRSLKNAQGWLIAIFIIVFIAVLILAMVALTGNEAVDSSYSSDFRNKDNKLSRNKVFTLGFVITLLELPLLIYCLNASQSLKGFFSTIAIQNCSNLETNEIISEVAKGLEGASLNNIINFCLLSVVYFCGIVLFLWKRAGDANETRYFRAKAD